MLKNGLFTSESVSPGHPDKIADQISDAILDASLAKDPHSLVACECLVKTGLVMIAGEMNTQAWVDTESIARRVIHAIGYNHPEIGFDADSCAVITAIGQQSDDIARGLKGKDATAQGAGDQGLMFGYACNETDVLMPAPIIYAHRLMQRQTELREKGVLSWLRPDAKSQVTIRYENGKPVGIHCVVLSTQHEPEISHKLLCEAVMDEIIRPTLPSEWIDETTQFHINPTGRFVKGGPQGDCGLTGRKIIVDTYGGMARHGGGCFSGKDPSKVDRSAAYMARAIAKQVVAAELATHCEVQLSYAIGVHEPTSLYVDTFGTGTISDTAITEKVTQTFQLTPYHIIQQLDLLRPIYQKTATFGHFGRADADFRWEQTDHVDALKA